MRNAYRKIRKMNDGEIVTPVYARISCSHKCKGCPPNIAVGLQKHIQMLNFRPFRVKIGFTLIYSLDMFVK